MPTIRPVKNDRFFIQWLHVRYIQDIADIECYSCEKFWSRKNIRDMMYHESTGGYVVTDLDKPVGYVVFEKDYQEKIIWIINIVIAPHYRRMGLGCLLLNRVKKLLKNKLVGYSLQAYVRDTNLGSHLFLQKNGFVGQEVQKSHFKDNFGESTEYADAYLFTSDFKANKRTIDE